VNKRNDIVVGLATATLFLLTAWGNARAMAVIFGTGGVVAIAVLAVLTWRTPRRRVFGRILLGMTFSFVVAAAVAMATTHIVRGH
jgi:hypothetical protein